MEWEQLRELVILGVLSLARGDTPMPPVPSSSVSPRYPQLSQCPCPCPRLVSPARRWSRGGRSAERAGGRHPAQWEVQVPEQGQLKPGDIWGHSGTIWGHSGTFGVIGGFGDVGG
ncbi:uncharacterized protein [Taeniopygia guttata]|uniref:uncharacterized protein n=1 Tax=Taeniopygia guttata TaxID=59729 RepID=UPI003BB95A8D